MAKQVKTQLKLQIPAGEATPAPPVGPALGQHGVPIMDFVKAFNDKTMDQKGTILPVVITVYEKGGFDFIVKKPPASEMIKKILGIEKGSEKPGREKRATITQDQLRSIAEEKLSDLNTNDVDQAMKVIAGSARSMGIEVEG